MNLSQLRPFLLLVFVSALFSACAAVPAESDALKIMTFNIRYGTAPDGDQAWQNRRECAFGVIRDSDPDILCVQEALRFQLDEIRAAFPQYMETGVGRDDGKQEGEYAAILYKKNRFTKKHDSTFWFSNTPAIPGSRHWGNNVTRICTFALLADGRTGKKLHVYNLHLDHESSESRMKSAALLLGTISRRSEPAAFVVAGDFNSGADSPVAALLLGSEEARRLGVTLRDMHAQLHPGDNSGTYHAYSGEPRSKRIDLLLASPDFQAVSSVILRTFCGGIWPSDHFPVLVTARF